MDTMPNACSRPENLQRPLNGLIDLFSSALTFQAGDHPPPPQAPVFHISPSYFCLDVAPAPQGRAKRCPKRFQLYSYVTWSLVRPVTSFPATALRYADSRVRFLWC